MAWTIHAGVAPILHANARIALRMGRPVRVFGVAMKPAAYRSLLVDTLGIDECDLGDERAIAARLSTTLGDPCTLPEALASVFDVETHRHSLALARAMGVDPVRLALAAHQGVAEARSEGRRIAVGLHQPTIAEAERGGRGRLEISVSLSNGVSWRGARMIARRAGVPRSVLASLGGLPLVEAVGLEWEGWRGVTIVAASVSGTSLVMDTDADAKTILQAA